MEKVYNSEVCKTGDESFEASYSFPYFDSNEYEDTGPNVKFANMYQLGFPQGNDTIEPFGAYNPFNNSKTTNNTGAIRIPVGGESMPKTTDDTSNIFKVNMASNSFTSLNVTYAGAASLL
jgi:hypothetical protein